MNENDPILTCILPPAGGDRNRYATIGDDVRDYVYEHIDPYPEVLWALVAGLAGVTPFVPAPAVVQ